MSSPIPLAHDAPETPNLKSKRRKRFWLLGLLPVVLLGSGLLTTGLRGPGRGHRARQNGAGTRPESVTLVALNSEPETHPTANTPSESNAASNNAEALAWSRFRGPNGSGISSDASIPTKWSETENLKWSTELPGPGSSSPILTEKFVFVTCYSGIDSQSRQTDTSNLKRHLICLGRQEGKIRW
ncbi:MAG: hypothetical protein ACKN82_06920, partial [Pirellula sp.]